MKKMRLKKFFFYVVLIAIPFVLLEFGLRAFLSFKIGPSVFWYGTKYFRQTQTVTVSKEGAAPQRVDPTQQFAEFDKQGQAENAQQKFLEDRSVVVHNNIQENYSKYFPHQRLTDLDEHDEKFTVTINQSGFRGKDFDVRKKPGSVRIITLGASSTFGWHDRDNETYPYYLEEQLNQYLAEHPCKNITSFEVLNLGVPHLTSEQIYALFVHEAIALEPDLVTFYEGLNDATVPRGTVAAIAQMEEKVAFLRQILNWGSQAYTTLHSWFVTVVFIDNLRDQLIQGIAKMRGRDGLTRPKDYVQSHLVGRSENFLKNIAAIAEECQKRHILFIAANQQAASLLLPRTQLKGVTYAQEVALVKNKLETEGGLTAWEFRFLSHSVLMQDLKKWALTAGIPFVDIIAAMDQARDNLLTWVHLTPAGNQVIASALAKEIFTHVCP